MYTAGGCQDSERPRAFLLRSSAQLPRSQGELTHHAATPGSACTPTVNARVVSTCVPPERKVGKRELEVHACFSCLYALDRASMPDPGLQMFTHAILHRLPWAAKERRLASNIMFVLAAHTGTVSRSLSSLPVRLLACLSTRMPFYSHACRLACLSTRLPVDSPTRSALSHSVNTHTRCR